MHPQRGQNSTHDRGRPSNQGGIVQVVVGAKQDDEANEPCETHSTRYASIETLTKGVKWQVALLLQSWWCVPVAEVVVGVMVQHTMCH